MPPLGAFTEDFNLNWWVQSHSPGYTMAGTQRALQHELEFVGGYVPFKGTVDMRFARLHVSCMYRM